MNKKGFTVIELLIVVAIVGILATVIMSAVQNPSALSGLSTSDNSRQRNALLAIGLKDIELRSPSWVACGKDDSLFSSNDFSATNPNGARVSGTVCCGILKGCTVRF